MRFCWWIVTFEYRCSFCAGMHAATYSVFTTSAEKAWDATAIQLGFQRVLTIRGTWAPLDSLLINYHSTQN